MQQVNQNYVQNVKVKKMDNSIKKTVQENEELKKAMGTILGRQVFMPQILIVKNFIQERWGKDNFQEYHDISSYAQKLCPDLLGETEENAKKMINEISGIDYRVTMRDGQPYIITQDLKFNRINLVIENNLVTKADIG